jgi:hypothetical protein
LEEAEVHRQLVVESKLLEMEEVAVMSLLVVVAAQVVA